MHSPILESARNFLWCNGRLLERRLFSHLFEGAPAQPVLQVLRAYQNEDGGFGNALEPDKRASDSQPIDQKFALLVMEDSQPDDAMINSMLQFLESITTTEGGIPFVLPTARSAPRAPWWNTEDNPPASINPTAGITGLLHKFHVKHPWLDRATEFCWKKIEQMEGLISEDTLTILKFLEYVPERDRALDHLEQLRQYAFDNHHIELNPDAEGYVHMPLEIAPRPDSLCRAWFDDQAIQSHLEALKTRQKDDGGWPISWPTVSPACELEFRGIITLRELKILRAYHQL